MTSLKQQIEKKAFYQYDDKIQREPRKDCSGKKCNRYREAGYSVHCDDYVAGWCRSYDENEGIPHDEKLVKVSDVLGLLVDCVCIPRKQLEELYDRYHGEDDSKRELIKELLGSKKKAINHDHTA